MRLLCISDIHGHLDALAAVLATAERRSFHKILVAGDIVFPGPAALETWRRLAGAGAILVQGVADKALATLDPDARFTPGASTSGAGSIGCAPSGPSSVTSSSSD